MPSGRPASDGSEGMTSSEGNHQADSDHRLVGCQTNAIGHIVRVFSGGGLVRAFAPACVGEAIELGIPSFQGVSGTGTIVFRFRPRRTLDAMV